jgi:DNA-binding SARP family transcriptional activator/tetratricopeptide (TPR) repeat protein
VEFRLLGRLEADLDGQPFVLGRRRERCLLGLLLLEANRPITVDRLVDLLWDGDAPSTARSSLHTHISRLRGRLDPDGTGRSGIRLVARDGGYLVEIDRHRVDAHRFQAMLRRAQQAGQADRVELLREGLALWRGPVLADVAPARLRERVGAELTEQRMLATELMIDAELAAGRHQKVIGELSALTAEHPYRERFAGQLMLALYRSDRYTDALAVYRQLADRLGVELGLDPGSGLRELYAAILRRDPHLDGAGVASAAPGPAQLPAAPDWFTGRADELASLDKALTGFASGGTVVISAIGGAGGIGKTWLALHWAHQHLDRFPDGQLFVNLRGFDPSGRPMAPAMAVRGFLDALGVPPAAVPVEPAAQVGLYRSLLARRRMLIVLDNARDTDQVVDLLPGTSSCTAIVTSRDRLTGLVTRHSARPLALGVLDGAQARELLARRLGEQRLAAEPDAVAALVTGCAGLPLGLAIVAARALMPPEPPLSELAAALRDVATRLDAMGDDDQQANLRAVLSWSCAALTAQQARAFGWLGLAPGPDIGLGAAAALTDLAVTEVAAVLHALERQSLLSQPTPGRWRMHDLVRLYAAERAGREGAADALRRLVDFYLRTAHAAAGLLDPHRVPVTVDVQAPGVAPQPLADEPAALAWLDAEHPCLLATQRLAADHGWHVAVWQLAWALDPLHGRRGHVQDNVAVWLAGLAAARHVDDRPTQLLAHRRLGNALGRAGRPAAAIGHLDEALTLAEEAGDLPGRAHTHVALAQPWEQQGDDRRALEHASQAVRLYQELGSPAREAMALNLTGWYLTRLGEHEQAEARLHAALALSREHGYRDGEADTLDSLGYLAHHAGRHGEALRHYQQAVDLYREVGNSYGEASTLDRLGVTHHALDAADRAREAWQQALELYRAQRRAADEQRVLERLSGTETL